MGVARRSPCWGVAEPNAHALGGANGVTARAICTLLCGATALSSLFSLSFPVVHYVSQSVS